MLSQPNFCKLWYKVRNAASHHYFMNSMYENYDVHDMRNA